MPESHSVGHKTPKNRAGFQPHGRNPGGTRPGSRPSGEVVQDEQGEVRDWQGKTGRFTTAKKQSARLPQTPSLQDGGSHACALARRGRACNLVAQRPPLQSTDDAFIDARTITIGAEIAGRITEVAVTDNQPVQAGSVLLRIDDSDYQAALKQADAGVAAAQAEIVDVAAQIKAQDAKIDQAQRQAAQAEAALDFAKAEDQRNRALLARGTATEQQAQQAASTLRQDQAALASAEANVISAKSQVSVLQAQAKSAEAKLEQAKATQDQARTALSRTSIIAPIAGRATSISAAKGTYAQPGQVLMMFVPDQVWVEANFKETQLDLMRPEQPVDIGIDAYPEKTFRGHVDSIQAGSGTAFSLLPAENATGNYVKVVQRMPVKIVFDKPPDVLLGPGMSVVPTVKVR
ncbi:MAG: HlyD family secretion protein [Mesorhizobium sp.]|nr:MAG: HlyD family secretion protein [Mesorhizobium sp.]TIS89162.1 MAG: HlyD family secretion protein [Mesorhizobium sp.]